MGIYAAGGGNEVISGYGWSSTTGFDPAYSQGAMYAPNGQFLQIAFPTIDTGGFDWAEGLWIRVRSFWDDSVTQLNKLLEIRDASSSLLVEATTEISLSQWYWTFYTNSGSGQDSQGFPFSTLVRANFIDFHFKVVDSQDTVIEVYLNGGLHYSRTISGQTTFNMPASLRVFPWNYSNYRVYLSEFILANEPTLNMRVKTIRPSSDGYYSGFTGAYSDIDDTMLDQNYLEAETIGSKHSYAVPAQSYLGNIGVTALVHSVYGSAQPGYDLKSFVRADGVDYDIGNLGLTVSNNFCQQILYNNPETDEPWGQENFSSYEFGFELVGLP